MTTDTKRNPPPGANTLIPETFLDVPTQRLYALSIGALCQVCDPLYCAGRCGSQLYSFLGFYHNRVLD